MGDNRPARYVEDDGRVIYRASSLGLCDKLFVAIALGYDLAEHPAWFQQILDEGTNSEQVIRELHEQSTSNEVDNVGKVLEMEVMDGVWIRGSIDGTMLERHRKDDQLDLCEYKKVRDSGWHRYLTSGVEYQANYPMQASIYMHMLEELVGHPVGMRFVGGHYEQANGDGEWQITEIHEHYYDTPPISLMAIKRRIVSLERTIKNAVVIGDVACTTATYPCPAWRYHDADDTQEPPTRPTDDTVAPLVREWASLDEGIKACGRVMKQVADAKKRQKELEVGIKAWLEASGQDSGDVSQVEVDGNTVALKYLVSPRKGYSVEPGEVTKVTVRVTAKDGKDTGVAAPKPSKAKVKTETAPVKAVAKKQTGKTTKGDK